MSATLITLTAKYESLNGTPLKGTVTFTPSATIQDTAGNVIYPIVPYPVGLDNTGGNFSITLPSTDDSTTQPSGLSYTVSEEIVGAPKRTYTITLPHNVASVDLADITPASAPPAVTYGVVSADLASTTDATKGAALVGYKSPLSGAVARTVYARLNDTVHAADFGVSASETAANNTSRLQGLLTNAALWSELILPPGTIQINDTLTLGFFQYKIIRGAGNGATVIQQNTDNTPILKANRKNTHNIQLHDLTLSYLNQQDATMTNAYCLQFASEDSNASGFYWWKLHNVSFLNAYIGMGILQQAGFSDLWWGFDGENLFFSHIQHNAISSLAAVSTGKPANQFRNTKIINTGGSVITADSAALWLSAGEFVFTTLDIEGWYNEAIHLAGGSTCVIQNLHVEHHTWNASNPYLVFVSGGPILIQTASISGTASPVSGNARIFNMSTGGVLEAKDILNTITTTAGTTSFLNGTSGVVRMQNITNSSASSPAITIPSAVSGSNALVERWDDNYYANGVILGNGTRIKKHLSGTATWDPASTADGAITSTTVTVTGAAIGDTVAVGFSVAVPAGCLLVGAVTATDTVTVTLFNKSGSTQDLGSGTLRADVWQH